MNIQKSCSCSGEQLLNVYPDLPNLFQAMEEGRPVGHLSVFCPTPETAEIGAFVPEHHRRQGIFTALLTEAAGALLPYGFQRLLFPCGGESAAGLAVCAHLGLALDHREYLMSHTCARPPFPAGLEARQSAGEGGFPCLELWEGPTLVGTAYCNADGETASIFGLSVPEGVRGQGYGKKLVAALLSRLPPERPVMLEVDAANVPALRLYRSCGFTVRRQVDYYAKPLRPAAPQSGG